MNSKLNNFLIAAEGLGRTNGQNYLLVNSYCLSDLLFQSTKKMGRSKTMNELKSMSRRKILTNVFALACFLIICMGGGGAIGAVMASDFGDDSDW